MIDLDYIYNTSEGVLGTPNLDMLPWEGVDYMLATGTHELSQMGLVQWSRPGTVRLTFTIDAFDLPSESNPPDTHRYWNPNYADGREFMTTVPKCDIFFMERYSVGEPMLIRYYFWSDKEKMDAIISEPTMDQMMSSVSDVVNRIVPIPSSNWQPPIWLPLPNDLSSNPIIRAKSLTAQQ